MRLGLELVQRANNILNNPQYKIEMSENKKPCPQIPFWGASYPDACCVDGKLQDLDYCDENGNLYDKGEDVPCPFCQTEEFIRYDPFLKKMNL